MSLEDLQTLGKEVEELVSNKLANCVGDNVEMYAHLKGDTNKQNNVNKTLKVDIVTYSFSVQKGNNTTVEPRMKSRGIL